MKTTPFTHFHEALGARMAPFAGYNMPIEYPTGIKEEHLNVRNKLGVFDVSHMGEFWIKGPKAFELVQKLTTNDVAALIAGESKRQVRQRVFSALEQYAQSKYNNIAISGHGITLTETLHALNIDKEDVDNGEIIHLQYDNDNWRYVGCIK